MISYIVNWEIIVFVASGLFVISSTIYTSSPTFSPQNFPLHCYNREVETQHFASLRTSQFRLYKPYNSVTSYLPSSESERFVMLKNSQVSGSPSSVTATVISSPGFIVTPSVHAVSASVVRQAMSPVEPVLLIFNCAVASKLLFMTLTVCSGWRFPNIGCARLPEDV